VTTDTAEMCGERNRVEKRENRAGNLNDGKANILQLGKYKVGTANGRTEGFESVYTSKCIHETVPRKVINIYGNLQCLL
jgi:hypothetical protein